MGWTKPRTAFTRDTSFVHLEQSLFVVAQHANRPGLAEQPQHSGAVRTASDQVPNENQAIGVGIPDGIEQFRELGRTAVDVSDEYCATHTRQVTWLTGPVKSLS